VSRDSLRAIVHRKRAAACLPRLRYSQPDRRIQAFNELVLIERLAQEADRSVVGRTHPVFLVRKSGNKNDRRLVSLRPQCFLQFKSVQPWHLQVCNQTRRLRDQTDSRKCAADMKATPLYPNDSTSSRIPSRASESSSTIEINGDSDISTSDHQIKQNTSSTVPHSKYLIYLKSCSVVVHLLNTTGTRLAVAEDGGTGRGILPKPASRFMRLSRLCSDRRPTGSVVLTAGKRSRIVLRNFYRRSRDSTVPQ
jgi:hypothetical protein